MKQFKYYLMAAFVAAATCTGFSSCSDNDDEESTVNPAVDVVTRTKQHDTAILLCTFGSTYNESLSVYDDVIEDFKAKFPNTDIYMSFTSLKIPSIKGCKNPRFVLSARINRSRPFNLGETYPVT